MLIEINAASISPPIKELLAFATSRVETEYIKYIEEPKRRLYGMYVNDVIIGCIGIETTSERSCEVRHIAVLTKERGNKVGSKMLDTILKSFSFNHLAAETDQDAVNFYRKYGFHITSLGEKYPGVERFKCEYYQY